MIIYHHDVKNEESMNSEGRKYRILDELIDEVLSESPRALPEDFTSRVLERVEQPGILKELAFESTMKIGLVIGVFIILATSFILFGIADLHTVGAFLSSHRSILIPATVVILFSWLFNDVVLKYMMRKASWQRRA